MTPFEWVIVLTLCITSGAALGLFLFWLRDALYDWMGETFLQWKDPRRKPWE